MLFTRTKNDFPDIIFGQIHYFPNTDKKQVKIAEKTNIYHFYRILLWISLIDILLIDFFLEDEWFNKLDTFGLLKEVFFF